MMLVPVKAVEMVWTAIRSAGVKGADRVAEELVALPCPAIRHFLDGAVADSP